MVWYAITEFIWGSTTTAPKTRAKTRIEEGWILVDTDISPNNDQKREVNIIEESPSLQSLSTETIRKSTRTKKKYSTVQEDTTTSIEENRKLTSRAKYMRDARRVLTQNDYEVATVKDDTHGKGGARQRKMPTARKLKREELRKSFSPKRASSRSSSSTPTFQPRRSNH